MLTSFKQTACLLFSRWPLEIRRLVYHELLVASCIDHPDRLVEDRISTLIITRAQKAMYKLGIDTTVLRTCRQIYIEALPMLYGDNKFVFFSASALEVFRDKGLVGIPRKFSLFMLQRTRTKVFENSRRQMRRLQRSLIQLRPKPSRSAIADT